MRAAILEKPGGIHFEAMPHLPPLANELEMEVNYVGICGSDISRFDGRLVSPKAVIFGHEFSGRVSAWGQKVSGYHYGQPVTAAPLLNCGSCKYCAIDKGYLCTDRVRFGTDVDGALRKYVSIRADRIYPLSEHIPLVHGALAEPLAVAVHAVRQPGSISGARVGVIGAGAIGLLIAMVARAYDMADVVLVDIDERRIRLAEKLGFTGIHSSEDVPIQSIQAKTDGKGVDFLFEASGSSKIGNYLLPMLATLGTIIVVGRIEQPIPIELDTLMMKEARILSSRYFSLSDFQEAVNLITNRLPGLELLIEDTLPFAKLKENAGRDVMDAARRAVRLIIDLTSESD